MGKALTTAAILLLVCNCSGGDGRAIFTPMAGTTGSVVRPAGPSQCGGAGGSQAAGEPNMLDLIVDPGPMDNTCTPIGYTNGLFATVTICVPGTTTCQIVDHMLVDTGSMGVRVLEEVLTLPLPNANAASGEALAECLPFLDGSAWGPLKTADVRMGSESAAGLTVHLIGENTFAMPSSCTGTAITDFTTLAANGILGVGIYRQDCGAACALSAKSPSNPGAYYACSGAVCQVASVPVAQQVWNPVVALPVDNNGVIIQLPSVGPAGAPSVPGQLLFGIGTQANNVLGSATVIGIDRFGFFTTAFPVGGTSYSSILDSGSNAIFFLDAATSNLKQCTGGLSSFYCPAATTNLSTTVTAANGAAVPVDFSVANISRQSNSAFALSNLAGPMLGYPSDPTIPAFDWGLSFFFGRSVYTAIEGQPTDAGAGPYFAF